MTRRLSGYTNGPVNTVPLRVRRNIPDGVLTANVAGDAFTDVHYFVEFFGNKRFTPGCLGQVAEHFRIGIMIVGRKKTDRVNDCAGTLRHLQDLRKAVDVGVVVAVADEE